MQWLAFITIAIIVGERERVMTTVVSLIGGQTAVATSAADDPALGPAASLALRGEKNDLTLRNVDGRLGWTKDPFGRVYTVGFVHITKPLRRIREQPRFAEDLKALAEELGKVDADYRRQLEELKDRVEGIAESDPTYAEMNEQGQRLYQEYMAWQRSALERKSKLEAEQLEEAYRQLISAVEIVSDRLGVDIVYRFIATGEAFESPDLPTALNEVRFRSVLRYPEDLDITPEVMKELGVEE